MSYYYICDACGSIVTITAEPIPENDEWACADCGAHRMWEFTNKHSALAHAEHIRGVVKSGLFHSAS